MEKTVKEIYIQTERSYQIPVKDETVEYKRLIKFLREKGYSVAKHLLFMKDDDHYVAIVVDNTERSVFTSNVTCMAAWCSNGKRRPLNVKEFIDNYEEFVINNNIDKYNEMIIDKARRGNK